MRNFKIGFFYNIVTGRSYHNNRLLLTYEKDCLCFRLINPNILPKDLHLSNMRYYSFDYPVIYEYSNGDITSFTFLSDVPLSSTPEKEKGFCFNEPSLKLLDVSLYYDGIEIFSNDTNKLLPEELFNQTVIYYSAVLNKLSSLDSNTDIFVKPYLEKIKKTKQYIDGINIESIVSDLQIIVYDSYRSKVGGDDRYSIYKEVFVSNPIASEDEYLKKLIEVGCNCIYNDSGYTSNLTIYAKSFIKDNPLGNYSGDLLEKEKQKIISSYSKEEHMGYIIAKYFVDKEYCRRCILPSWSEVANKVSNKLYDEFHLNAISNDDRQFEKKMYVLESAHTDAQKEIDTINAYVKEITSYDNNKRKLNSLDDFEWDAYAKRKKGYDEEDIYDEEKEGFYDDGGFGEYMEEQMREYDLQNTEVKSWSLKEFVDYCRKKGCFKIIAGADYYPFTEGGENALIFKMKDGSSISVFYFSDYTVKQIKENIDVFSVSLMKSGYYMLYGNIPENN